MNGFYARFIQFWCLGGHKKETVSCSFVKIDSDWLSEMKRRHFRFSEGVGVFFGKCVAGGYMNNSNTIISLFVLDLDPETKKAGCSNLCRCVFGTREYMYRYCVPLTTSTVRFSVIPSFSQGWTSPNHPWLIENHFAMHVTFINGNQPSILGAIPNIT